jgi:hypothetical protein
MAVLADLRGLSKKQAQARLLEMQAATAKPKRRSPKK